MLTFKGTPNIVLDVDKGLYTFIPESGSGKTFLFNVLRDHQLTGAPIVTYDYSDYLMGLNLEEQIKKSNPEVIMVDRLDCFVFADGVHETLRKAAEKAVVLVDLKYLSPPPIVCKFAGIDFTSECIEVVG